MGVGWNNTSPGIYQTAGNGNIFHADNTLVSALAPAHSGEQVVLYASGLGAVDQSVASGAQGPYSPLANTVVRPVVKVGGVQANVIFFGLTPGVSGLYQVNFVVPSGLTGEVPVVLGMAGVTSNVVTMSAAP